MQTYVVGILLILISGFGLSLAIKFIFATNNADCHFNASFDLEKFASKVAYIILNFSCVRVAPTANHTLSICLWTKLQCTLRTACKLIFA